MSAPPLRCYQKSVCFFSQNILFATAWTHRISVRVRQTKFPKSIMLTAVFLAWVLFPVKCATFPRSPSFTQNTIVTHTIEKLYASLSEHQTWLGQCCFVLFFAIRLTYTHTHKRHIVFQLARQIPSKMVWQIPQIPLLHSRLKLTSMFSFIIFFFLALMFLYFMKHKQFNWMLDMIPMRRI